MLFRRFLVGFSAVLVSLAATACQPQPKPNVNPNLVSVNTTSPPCVKNIVSPTLPKDAKSNLDILVKSNNAFALDLYSQLCSNQKGNLFVSPYSVSTALAMTYAGAKGETETEMAKVLHFSLAQTDFHPAFSALIRDLKPNGKGYQLLQANRLWGQKGSNFQDSFLKITKDNYGSKLSEVDFVNASEEARRTINNWVMDQTQDKIPGLFPQGSLNKDTRLVLANAIYFKGTWLTQFNAKQTDNQPFNITGKDKVNVPMMSKEDSSSYYADLKELQVLEMPYVGDRLSMVILLPNKVDGLADLEQKLTPENLDKWLSSLSLHSEKVIVFLPKFTITSAFALNQVLSKMGMPLAFSDKSADFSGMNGKKDLFLSKVVHKAFVDVYEEGTEAAAATGIGVPEAASVEPQPFVFRADHPFIFLIRDRKSGSILFMGRVINPLN